VNATLTRLFATDHGSRELVANARGVLVFPSVFAAGFWFGGQYGQGALRIGEQTSGYYSIAAASFGLQIGAQSKAIIMLFMTQEALDNSRTARAGQPASTQPSLCCRSARTATSTRRRQQARSRPSC
jgi:lipid-binding SYLF domain-containing protein